MKMIDEEGKDITDHNVLR